MRESQGPVEKCWSAEWTRWALFAVQERVDFMKVHRQAETCQWKADSSDIASPAYPHMQAHMDEAYLDDSCQWQSLTLSYENWPGSLDQKPQTSQVCQPPATLAWPHKVNEILDCFDDLSGQPMGTMYSMSWHNQLHDYHD